MFGVDFNWKRIVFVVLGLAACSALFLTFSSAHADEPEGGTGALTIPWDEFKHLLNLDDDQIVLPLATFEKLVAQATGSAVPPHATQGGNVILTRAAFQELVDRMKPPVGPGAEPPFPYLMTKAAYSGTMRRNATAITGTFHVNVLARDVYLKVPILPQATALENVAVDGKPALLVSENGQHCVVLSTPGEHVVTASFAVKSSLERGPHRIDFMIQPTPITLLSLEIPMDGIEVEIPQAQQLATRSGSGRTVVTAAITPGQAISVRWRAETESVETLPPRLYAEACHLVSIEDDALRIATDVAFNILHSEINRVRLSVPDGMNVLSVQGEGVGEWQEAAADDGGRTILVPFTYGRKGAVAVRITAEVPFSEDGAPTAFTGLGVLDCVRETGFLGVEVRTSAEVTVVEEDGLEPVSVPSLPPTLQSGARKPLMHGFKYLKHPYHLVLSIRKHQKLDVPVAAISSANAVTLFTEDGKVVHRLVYQVINSAKQFLEVRVPAEADVWTVFVDDQPVESAVNGEGVLLVPLIRSRPEGNRLSPFPVEIVYCMVGDRFSGFGTRGAMLPAVDLLVSQLLWSVYLPNDYTYLRFTSTLEKEELIRGLNLLARSKRQYDEGVMAQVYEQNRQELEAGLKPGELPARGGRDAYRGAELKSEFRNQALNDERMKEQLGAEIEFGRRMDDLDRVAAPASIGSFGGTGVLPIEIAVPTGGQVYRFARTIIRPDEPLTMDATFGANGTMTALRWGLLALGAVMLYLLRRVLFRALRRVERRVRTLVGFLRGRLDGTQAKEPEGTSIS